MSPEQGSELVTTESTGEPHTPRESSVAGEVRASTDVQVVNDAHPIGVQHTASDEHPVDLQSAADAPTTCANCGASGAGHYCWNCGQRHEHSVHSVWHFTREATEDLTHADSRLWSTLAALLYKPGFLTREFLAGRRVRYLPPLRLYLVLSVLFFVLVTSSHHAVAVVVGKDPQGHASVTAKPPSELEVFKARPGETQGQRLDRVCNPEYNGPARKFILPFLKHACRRGIDDNGRTITETYMHNVPRAMFLFLPVLALAMKPLYWRPRRYYVEHLLFLVHNHAFGFLFFTLLWFVSEFTPAVVSEWVTFFAWTYAIYYIFAAMRRVYGQSRWLTFAKFSVLSFVYLISVSAMLALTGVYSVSQL
jgi:hypothetical protein